MRVKPSHKKLLLTILMGILMLSNSLGINLAADDLKPAADHQNSIHLKGATRVIQNPDGSSIQIDADGSKIIKNADKSSLLIKPNGSKVIQHADGTFIHIHPNGSRTVQNSDGSEVELTRSSPSDIISLVHLFGQFSVSCDTPICRIRLLGNG